MTALPAVVFFFNDTATTEIYTVPYTLSLHDALPISAWPSGTSRPASRAFVPRWRSEEHTSELQSHGTISYAVFCLKKKKTNNNNITECVSSQHTHLYSFKQTH